MTEPTGKKQTETLPPIPAKRYFKISEVSELCGVKAHVLRYWEQQFPQLNPVKREGKRRNYQHHEILLIRRIRKLLYEQGFKISAARKLLSEPGLTDEQLEEAMPMESAAAPDIDLAALRTELEAVLAILTLPDSK